MNLETKGWIATAILSPICLIVLSWMLVIFHSNRRKWQSKDLIVSTLVTEGVIKLIATFAYALITLLQPLEFFQTYCGCVQWLITSIDVLRVTTIATLIFTRLLAVRFPAKFRATVKRTHLYYHFITLGILSSCIGVASILSERVSDDLAKENNPGDVEYCTFLPYELNPKYAFLSISLHFVVNLVTVVALFWTVCVIYDKHRHTISDSSNVSNSSTIIGRNGKNQRHDLANSASNLSRLSESSLREGRQNGRVNGTHETNFGSSLSSRNEQYNLGRIFDNQRYGNDNYYGDISSGKSSTDTLKSSKLAQSYHQLMYSGQRYGRNPSYDEICSPSPVNRWASESSYLSTSTSSTNSRAPCLNKKTPREENLGIETTSAIFLLCFSCNQLPFLMVTILGTFVPSLLENLPLNAYLLWAGLLQECLLPMLLPVVDRDFKIWLHQVYASQHRTPLAKHQGLDGKFRVFSTPLQSMQPIQLMQNEPTKFPITNGSLFTSVDGRLPIIHNYRRGLGIRSTGLMASHCVSMGLPAAMRRVEFDARLQEQDRQAEKLEHSGYRHPGSCNNDIDLGGGQHRNGGLPDFSKTGLNFESFRSNTLELSEFEDSNDYRSEPIYATLSSRSCCSATTAANDDFEFYQTDIHATVKDEITKSIFDSGDVKDFEESTELSICPVIENINYILTHDSDSEDCAPEIVEVPAEINATENHTKRDCVTNLSVSGTESNLMLGNEPTDSGNLSNEEIVSLIERCFMDIHEQYSGDSEPQQEPKVEPLVLESFNNLKHLHEIGLLHERKRLSSKSLEEDFQCINLLLDDTNSNKLLASKSFQEILPKRDEQSKPYEAIESEVHENANRRLYKKTAPSRKHLEPLLTKRQSGPSTNRRLMKPRRLEKTPPLCRRSLADRTKMSASNEYSHPGLDWSPRPPLLSEDGDLSYLDNGDVWSHSKEPGGSKIDLKKIFVSEFI